MVSSKSVLIEDMSKEELRDELRRLSIYTIGLVEQRENASKELYELMIKWEKKPLKKKDWVRLSTLVY